MKKFKKIVIASRNPAKVASYRAILMDISEEVLGLGDLGINGTPEESGLTAEENAQIKALYYSEKCGLPVFSEDEALYVDFLDETKQPGVHVRRVNGKNAVDDEELLRYWEGVISAVPEESRTGRWHIAYCIAMTDGMYKTVAVDYEIRFFSPTSKIRLPGWPMSSLEGSALIGKSHSEQTPEEKKILDDKTVFELRNCLRDLT